MTIADLFQALFTAFAISLVFGYMFGKIASLINYLLGN